jgi:hypothetical protein
MELLHWSNPDSVHGSVLRCLNVRDGLPVEPTLHRQDHSATYRHGSVVLARRQIVKNGIGGGAASPVGA